MVLKWMQYNASVGQHEEMVLIVYVATKPQISLCIICILIKALIWQKKMIPLRKLIPGFHYENTPIQIYWKFYHQKMKIFR